MAFDLKQGIGSGAQAALAFLAAKKAGPQAVAALMQGIQQGKLQKQQMAQEEQDRALRQQMLQAQMDDRLFTRKNTEADNARQDEEFRLRKIGMAGGALNDYATMVGQTADDPIMAQDQLAVRASGLEQTFGIPQGQVAALAPPMAPMISHRKKKQAQELYDRAEKRYNPKGENPDWETSITLQTGEQFGDVTPAKLREMFEAPAVGQDGAPAQPPRPAVVPPNRNLQSKEVMRNGRRVVVNFEPDTGKYFDLSGAEVTDIEPIAPVSAGGGGGTGLPASVMRRVDTKTRAFEALPVVKTTQKMAEAVSFANSLSPNTTNPADDQALIYAFAKAMDPDSVVREGEYATVQKYAQSWAESFGFNATRIFSNTQFLTPQARANMKATILAKFEAGRTQYENVRKSYVEQINKITGSTDGEDYLTDYGGAFPQSAAPASTAPIGVPSYQDYLRRRGVQ